MIDDILDITQDSSKLGKPAMHDYQEGKCTLPYIYLYERLDSSGKDKLRSLHAKRLSDKDIEWIKSQMVSTGALQEAMNEAKSLAQGAVELMKSEGNKELERVAMQMIQRSF